MQRFLLYKYTLTHKIYTILLSRDLKTKKVRHPHPHPHPHPQKKKVFGVKSEILIKYKRIKWTPNRKALHLLPGGKYYYCTISCSCGLPIWKKVLIFIAHLLKSALSVAHLTKNNPYFFLLIFKKVLIWLAHLKKKCSFLLLI